MLRPRADLEPHSLLFLLDVGLRLLLLVGFNSREPFASFLEIQSGAETTDKWYENSSTKEVVTPIGLGESKLPVDGGREAERGKWARLGVSMTPRGFLGTRAPRKSQPSLCSFVKRLPHETHFAMGPGASLAWVS